MEQALLLEITKHYVISPPIISLFADEVHLVQRIQS